VINFIVRAQEAIDPDPVTNPTGYGDTGLGDLLTNVGTTAAMAAGILLFGMLLFGGITWLTAQGNEDQVEKAQRIISNAVIGLVIVIAAFFITQILGSALGFGNIFDLVFPKP
jgi:cytochrome bd-type quinol oxidase subunit 2